MTKWRAEGDGQASSGVESVLIDMDAVDARSRRALHQRQLYTGLVSFIGTGTAALFYFAYTWDTGPNRPWLVLIGAIAVGQVLVWPFRRHFVDDAIRNRLFIGWVLLGYALIASASALDGGMGSPIMFVWVLPAIYLSMGFSRAAIVSCGAVAIGLYFAVAWATSGFATIAPLISQVVVLIDAILMVLLVSIAREERETVLVTVRGQLAMLAVTDVLTGCLNQPAFARATVVEALRARRQGHATSMIAIDIDHFKAINDTHGHLVGDAVLRRLGATLRASVRSHDVVGRVGGDELAVLCPETGAMAAKDLAERLQASVRGLPDEMGVTLSIGICTLDAELVDPRGLRERADRALYEAKHRGRDRHEVFDPQAV